MAKLLFKTLLVAFVVSPILALIGIVFDLSEASRTLLMVGTSVYIFIAYYFPRAEQFWWEARRKRENEFMDRFLAEREQRKDK